MGRRPKGLCQKQEKADIEIKSYDTLGETVEHSISSTYEIERMLQALKDSNLLKQNFSQELFKWITPSEVIVEESDMSDSKQSKSTFISNSLKWDMANESSPQKENLTKRKERSQSLQEHIQEWSFGAIEFEESKLNSSFEPEEKPSS